MSKMKVKTKIKLKKIDIFIFIFVFICFITFILIKKFTIRSENYISTYTINQTKNIAEAIVNKSVYDELLNNETDLSLMFNAFKNKDDEIISIDFNNIIVNEYLYKILNNIINNFNNLEQTHTKELNVSFYEKKSNIFFIPLGVIYDLPVLTFISPKIPFKINSIGNIESNIETKITEYGINNSLLEIIININLNLNVVYPFISNNIIIKKSIPIASKLIQGNIPSYYGGIITSTSPNLNNNIYE